MGVRVRISARLIRWPQMCACCLNRADTTFQSTHTRFTGTKVVHTHSRGWRVPYCSGCLSHIDAEARARSITVSDANTVLVLGIMLGLFVAAFGSCCCGPVILTPGQPAAGNQEPGAARIVVAIVASVVTGTGAVVGAYFWYLRLEANARRRQHRAIQHAKSLASRDCCTLGSAVAYEGWYGSVHTFWFGHSDYADAFIRANPGKIVDW